ncbi:MAG: transketolase [Actinobacteria bacterium]|nr:transketolase [Actinomycetota bacterium]
MQEEIVVKNLHKKAQEIRLAVVKMLANARTGHYGGSLSAADIITVLYFQVMDHDPNRPDWADRDRFVLSKGHTCPLLYVVLAEAGYFPKETLLEHRRLGSILQGHPDMRLVPGVEMSTGSLGQGLSAGVGMAIGAKLDHKDLRVYVMIGCGESQEGQIWEAAMAGAHYKLDNLTAVLDYNGLQAQGRTAQLMDIAPVADKWRSFGWHVIEIDGHNIKEIIEAFSQAKTTKSKPTMIVAHTIKGKGVSFMENNIPWHHIPASEQQASAAIAELEKSLENL